MNRYERYKDSGIPWLGEVPAHWNVVKLQYLISCTSGDALPSSFIYKDKDDGNSIPVIGGNGLFGYTTNSNFIGNCLSVGRVGALCGNIHYIDYPSWINDNALIVRLISDQILLEFLEYILISRNLNELASKTAQPLLTGTQVKYEKIVVPLIEEQTAIAHYLDTKLGEIDALIDKQQTLLEKLAEQRTAVITQAVTKGLNPAAPMKNSGVEWLGDVPAHWEVINLKFLCRVKGGYAFSSDNFSDEGIPVIRISDILFDGTVDNINCKRIPLELAPNQKDFELRNGQLVMAMTGATIGKISKYCSKDYAYINQRVGKFEAFNSRLYYEFLYHLLNTSGYQEHIKLTAFGGAQPNISDSEMVNYQMALPTMEEQANIADYLDKETAKIDRLCETVNQTIGRLKEYRTALITQAVTGKIKVTDE
jgi:restriction endonuclease S subunit